MDFKKWMVKLEQLGSPAPQTAQAQPMTAYAPQVNPATIGTELMDERAIDAVYDKAKYSVRLAQMYDKTKSDKDKLLLNISTIATLDQGVYGLYNSAENKKVIDQSTLGRLRMVFGDDIISNHKLDALPMSVVRQAIKQHAPDLDVRKIKVANPIHVNVRQHLAKHGDTLEAVLELASTIIHEARHDWERQNYGKTDESGPRMEEGKFMGWWNKNRDSITRQMPPQFAALKSSSSMMVTPGMPAAAPGLAQPT